jgi:hypothetical protein
MKKGFVIAVLGVFAVFAAGPAFATHHMTADGKLTLDKPVDKWPAAKMKEGKKAKNPVTFNHAKHGKDLGCVECHHADKDLKEGGKPAKLCFDCHGPAPSADGKQPSTYDMIHKKGCLDCHKSEKGKAAKAPTACKDCHGGAE